MANKKLLNQLWFFHISFLVLWALLTYGDTVKAFIDQKYFAYEMGGDVYTSDFLLYYNNGILAWEALKNNINIYDAVLQNQYLEKLAGIELKKIFYSQYPPYLFVLMMPLPLLKMEVVWIIWEIAGMVALLLSVWGMLKISLSGKFTRTFAFIATVASFPAWVCFRLGQVALLIYPAFIWYWLALEKRMWFTAGLLGGFCLLKLQYLPILFLTGVLLGGWRFFFGYATMGSIYLLSSGLILGWHNVLGYPEALKFGEISGKVTGVAPESQQNLRGQLVAIFQNDGSAIHLIAFVVWIVFSLFIAYLWWQEAKIRKEKGESDPDRRHRFFRLSSITVLILLITSPHTHRQDFIFASLPCLWLMFLYFQNNESGSNLSKAKLWLRYLILSFPMLSWLFFLLTYFLPVIIQPFFAWDILLLTVIFILTRTTKAVKIGNN